MENRRFIKIILIIICLTSIPFIIVLPKFFNQSLGWLLGALGSTINFLWLSYDTLYRFSTNAIKAKVRSAKVFYLRYFSLVIYSVFIIWLIKPDILTFGLGLFAAQISIYIYYGLETAKNIKWLKK
jgi:uncharacterized membrane protein